tara:strand:+ start:10960 stop:11661 length:702 start_codon:yes stop_codon:yes gene_type:complete
MKIFNDIAGFIEDKGNKKLVTFVNPYSYYILKESGLDTNFNRIYADGILLVKLYNLFNSEKVSRYSFDFTSVAPIAFSFFEENNKRVALIGGTNEEVIKAKSVIEKRHPNIDIALISHGFLCDKSRQKLIEDLNELKVEAVIAGLGTPLQEEFLTMVRDKVDSMEISFTCGGFITQISQNENYFHPIMNKLNLRWLQRFCRHSFVRRRILVDYPAFVFKFIFESLKDGKLRRN